MNENRNVQVCVCEFTFIIGKLFSNDKNNYGQNNYKQEQSFSSCDWKTITSTQFMRKKEINPY